MPIRAATASDIPAIAAYLAGALRGDGGAARYRRYLAPAWPTPSWSPGIGFVIEDADGRIGGFLGAIWSERRFAGVSHRVCNIHSCAVDERHRKATLQAFGQLLRDKDATYTCFSPSEQIAKILDFFKFAHRPGERVILPAVGVPRISTRMRATAVADALDDEGRRIAADHARYRCAQVVLTDGDRRCHVVAVSRGRGVRRFAEVLYASDRELLADRLGALRLPLLAQLRTPLVGIDRRWLPSPPRLSAVYAKLRPAYARSTLPIDQIDFLYSELVPMYA